MRLTRQEKEKLKRELVSCFENEPEIQKIVIFGSSVTTDSPHDIDIAVFQDSKQHYLPLALKYRRITRAVSRRIPVDILPIKPGATGIMCDEIARGEVIYER